MFFIAVFVAKLTAVTVVIPALLIGLLSKRWTDAILFAVVAAGINEAALHMMQYTREFRVDVFLIGYAAAIVWAMVGFWIRRLWASRKAA